MKYSNDVDEDCVWRTAHICKATVRGFGSLRFGARFVEKSTLSLYIRYSRRAVGAGSVVLHSSQQLYIYIRRFVYVDACVCILICVCCV